MCVYIYKCIVYFYINIKRYFIMILLFYYELQNTFKMKIK